MASTPRRFATNCPPHPPKGSPSIRTGWHPELEYLLAVVLFAATVIALTLVASPPGGHPGQAAQPHHNPKMGTAFVHTVIDDHSRVAYAEIHDDETAAPATTVPNARPLRQRQRLQVPRLATHSDTSAQVHGCVPLRDD